jgi:hypothetical protein
MRAPPASVRNVPVVSTNEYRSVVMSMPSTEAVPDSSRACNLCRRSTAKHRRSPADSVHTRRSNASGDAGTADGSGGGLAAPLPTAPRDDGLDSTPTDVVDDTELSEPFWSSDGIAAGSGGIAGGTEPAAVAPASGVVASAVAVCAAVAVAVGPIDGDGVGTADGGLRDGANEKSSASVADGAREGGPLPSVTPLIQFLTERREKGGEACKVRTEHKKNGGICTNVFELYFGRDKSAANIARFTVGQQTIRTAQNIPTKTLNNRTSQRQAL